MNNVKKIFTNFRVILLIFALLFSIVLINPRILVLQPFSEGVAIRNVQQNSSAAFAGIIATSPDTKPIFREVIFEIDGKPILNVNDYFSAVAALEPNDTILIRTRASYSGPEDTIPSLLPSVKTYIIQVEPLYETIILDETETIVEQRVIEENETINGTTVTVNRTVDIVKTVPKTLQKVIGKQDIGLDVYDAPSTNIRKGLDLQGGTRVLLEPEEQIDDRDLELITENLRRRLNVYGLSDIVIRSVASGLFEEEKLILVEVAGANQDEVRNLIASQGKFEAKVGNATVFLGGDDIRNVCRSPDCSFAQNPQRPCGRVSDGQYQCQFYFSISLSPEAAQRQADATRDLSVISENGQQYLSEKLQLYLDNELVDDLFIAADLKGRAVTDIAISGAGAGATLQDAIQDSATNMKKLQTVLITGSLPVKLNIVKIDSVSPSLGERFLNNAIVLGFGAIAAVALVILIRYRDFKVVVPVIITVLSEITMILGVAAGIGWNLDLAAIAGILIAVGTGVDDQIVILDETKKGTGLTWQERMKKAFFIIFAAFFTTLAAMLPLFAAGAGLLRGFALTTIIGIVVGVLIARPAFAAFVEILQNE